MDQEFQQRFDALEKKVDEVFVSAEKTRMYFLWTMIITVAAVVLPIIGLLFTLPTIISGYSAALGL